MNTRLISLFSLLLLFSPISLAVSPNLMRHAEFHVPPQDLITFSSAAITVKLCDECQAESIALKADTALFEYEQAIDLSRASEIYLRKNIPVIFIGIDRQQKLVDYINFGGHAPGEH
ncbi:MULTISPECIES: hypothetical protein [unclassified Oceanobacter]|jgi:hypothetical protein|uniref:hypothetical protein n=1 Tax=unclassified Oceanobacter TaxID=2620260 RepID=UPI0026E25F6D|nr:MULTISPECIES: hypothetical protein [unclassified Oceanobacter]MDO6681259.1 hypothetical protein [Oceanobacter sp. 5_MG-2023]MDP2505222.1 hypothetical protein [Oceanobacter sp. 3_MG-2023]MDP2549207.1 hypothetical protein [Oceanobacter sp. 4_MG-2023]MDP2608004.1 hypothetical protein [Oceanobacter sp. 1_MG-2023]MDP2611334.1 hypothetical protein [Oceanobacter sp. 2_MG-2023]